jgi:hypothetical protein
MAFVFKTGKEIPEYTKIQKNEREERGLGGNSTTSGKKSMNAAGSWVNSKLQGIIRCTHDPGREACNLNTRPLRARFFTLVQTGKQAFQFVLK